MDQYRADVDTLQHSWDDKVFVHLWDSLRGLRQHYLLRWYVCGFSWDQLDGELMMVVYQALKTYNGRVRFKSYLLRSFRNHLITLVRKQGTATNRVMSESISYDDTREIWMRGDDGSHTGTCNYVDILDPSAPDTAHLELLRSRLQILSDHYLTEFERKVLECWLKHATGNGRGCQGVYSVVAKHLNCSDKAVDNALTRVRLKAKQVGVIGV